jgi:hypothetical protein
LRIIRSFGSLGLALLPLVGCASTLPSTTAPVSAPVTLAAAIVDAPPQAAPVPVDDTPAATCEKAGDDSDACFARDDYREWLCGRTDPSAAVALFRKGTPWTRAYVTRDLDSWDPSRRSHKTHLALDEEVIVLHPYKPTGGVMIVGGTNAQGWTSLDAVRVDGTCVSLMADEVSMKRPPAPKHAPIAWDRLPDHARTELLASPDLRKKADQMERACTKAAEPRCAKAKGQLTDAVVAASGS